MYSTMYLFIHKYVHTHISYTFKNIMNLYFDVMLGLYVDVPID